MIGPPLNDRECLERLTLYAVHGQMRPDLRQLAGRFGTVDELAAWIRSLPQRDDYGDPADGPRIVCDVAQRVRLVADDPNCVERSLLYMAVAEQLDSRPTRQLATIETPNGRHTFPIEDGEPVLLEPKLTRNALRAGVWLIRNAGAAVTVDTLALDPAALLGWVIDLAEDVAESRHGRAGLRRIEQAREVFGRLLEGRPITPAARADALYALRLASEAAALFGDAGIAGIRIARAAVSRLAAALVPRPRNARVRVTVNPERAAYWTGKAIATYYGVGGLYDPIYQEVTKRPAASPPPPLPQPAPEPRREEGGATPAAVPGSLDSLATRKE